jgi:hypothetical protein
VGTHTGYELLDQPVRPIRTLTLEHDRHALTIEDVIEGQGTHTVTIPLHLAPGVEARVEVPGEVVLSAAGKEFTLSWSSPGTWAFEIGEGRISPSYGVVEPAVRLVWHASVALPASLTMQLAPREASLKKSLPNENLLFVSARHSVALG